MHTEEIICTVKHDADIVANEENYTRDYLDVCWEVAEPMIKRGLFTDTEYSPCEEIIFTRALACAGVI